LRMVFSPKLTLLSEYLSLQKRRQSSYFSIPREEVAFRGTCIWHLCSRQKSALIGSSFRQSWGISVHPSTLYFLLPASSPLQYRDHDRSRGHKIDKLPKEWSISMNSIEISRILSTQLHLFHSSHS